MALCLVQATIILSALFSDQYITLYPVTDDSFNRGATGMKTKEEMIALNLTVSYYYSSSSNFLANYCPGDSTSLAVSHHRTVIVKLDIEGYECKVYRVDFGLICFDPGSPA